jgi:hypothetical protein
MRRKIIEEIAKIRAPLKQARFYCRPGREVTGYFCDGVARIDRKQNETLEELRTRSKNAVEWKDDTTHIFTPFYK